MGSDNLHKRSLIERTKRRENIILQKPNNWLIVCEGEKTEPNYFKEAISIINDHLPANNKIKVKIIGKGENTISLVKTAEDLQTVVDENKSIIPYGKIFVVFDKDSFPDDNFNEAIKMCCKNNYIPLWSNQAIEYWFLSHFNLVDSKINREEYTKKLNSEFKKKGSNFRYKKNSNIIFSELVKNGSLKNARKNSKKIHTNFITFNNTPSDCESCTTVYQFFDEVDNRNKELELKLLNDIFN